MLIRKLMTALMPMPNPADTETAASVKTDYSTKTGVFPHAKANTHLTQCSTNLKKYKQL
jgi:hypothetical protein